MLKDYKHDSVVSFLVERCSLTPAQLDTIMIWRLEIKLGAMVGLRDKKKVTKGAFLRSLKQGQYNVRSSLYTMILLEYLGLIDSKQLFALGRIGELISKVKDSSPNADSIRKLLEGIEEFTETFCQRRSNQIPAE